MEKDVRLSGFQTLKTLREALEIIRKNITFKLPVEEIDIKDAYWRILAEDLISPINIPPFTRSAVDGYAVKFEDVSSASENSPVILDLVGESITGQPFEGHVKSGEAVYVSTGAKIPAGADTIIMVEYAKRQENKVEIYKSAPPSYNFSIEGEDVKKGEIILEKGRILTPYDIALLGNIGICKVKVRKRPIIGIILTGSELVEPCQEGQQNLKEEGKIIDNLSLILIGLINWFGFKYKHYGIVPDKENEIKKKLKEALSECDFVITTGGTSVGKVDFIPNLVNELGEQGVLFHGVALQPGKPFSISVFGEKIVFSIPGFSVAAIFDFHEIVIPTIFHVLGSQYLPQPPHVDAILKRRVSKKLGIRNFVRVRLCKEDDAIYAEPFYSGGAGILSSMVKTDGYFVVPEDTEGIEAGTKVRVFFFFPFVPRIQKCGE